jgi:hypothetical protein
MTDIEAQAEAVKARYLALRDHLDERQLRLMAAAEVNAIGRTACS